MKNVCAGEQKLDEDMKVLVERVISDKMEVSELWEIDECVRMLCDLNMK